MLLFIMHGYYCQEAKIGSEKKSGSSQCILLQLGRECNPNLLGKHYLTADTFQVKFNCFILWLLTIKFSHTKKSTL